jgi:hypothetical protein
MKTKFLSYFAFKGAVLVDFKDFLRKYIKNDITETIERTREELYCVVIQTNFFKQQFEECGIKKSPSFKSFLLVRL